MLSVFTFSLIFFFHHWEFNPRPSPRDTSTVSMTLWYAEAIKPPQIWMDFSLRWCRSRERILHVWETLRGETNANRNKRCPSAKRPGCMDLHHSVLTCGHQRSASALVSIPISSVWQWCWFWRGYYETWVHELKAVAIILFFRQKYTFSDQFLPSVKFPLKDLRQLSNFCLRCHFWTLTSWPPRFYPVVWILHQQVALAQLTPSLCVTS